jgi:hypothetical protein
MMNAPGSALVKTMPNEVVNWIAESVIVWSSYNGVRDNETEWFFKEPEECPEPEVVEVIVERPVYIEAECPACLDTPCPQPLCPIVDCPVPEPCSPVICPPIPTVICEPTECEECLCDEYCASQTEPVYIDLGGEIEDEEDDESSGHDEGYYDDD